MSARCFLLCLAVVFCAPSFADKKDNKKVRTVFLFKKKKDGKVFVAIRLTPKQFSSAKRRAKRPRNRKPGSVVLVALHPRQIVALHSVLGNEHRWSKVTLVVNAKRLRRMKGLKNRYVIREKDRFVKKKYKGKDSLEVECEPEESDDELDK